MGSAVMISMDIHVVNNSFYGTTDGNREDRKKERISISAIIVYDTIVW